MEEWKSIPGYEGCYEVSNLGRVKSLKCGKETVLKPVKNPNGYFVVGFFSDSKRKTKK